MKKTILLLMSILMIIPLTNTNKVNAVDNVEEIELSVEQVPDIDIALALGQSQLDGTTLGADVERALRARGFTSNLITIQAMEAVEQNIFDGKFTMNLMWGATGTDVDTYLTYMSGNTQIAQLFYGNKTEYGSSIDIDDTQGGRGEWTTVDFSQIPANVDRLLFQADAYARGPAAVTFSLFREVGGVRESMITDVKTVSDRTKVSFGEIVRNGDGWDFKYTNGRVFPGKVIEIVAKDFSETIRQPEWKDGSERFIVNLDDNVIGDFNNSQALGEIISRLVNENIDYLGVGTSANQAQTNRLIASNNDNGLFINSGSGYQNAVNSIANYIANKLHAQYDGQENMLVGNPVQFNVKPESYKKNTQNELFPNGRWKVDHDPTHFDNNTGQYIKSGIFQPDLDFVLDKPGKYELWFGTLHPEPRYIYVHRKPVASYTVAVNGTQVSVTDRSYDLDLQSRADRGISEYKWQWKETTSNTWNNGVIPSTLQAGRDYIVQLSVKDYQDTWSDPLSRYITTAANAVSTPIADFDMPTEAFLHNEIIVNNNSYDPAGKLINLQEWTITKNGSQVYKGSQAITNFRGYGVGKYTVSLKVRNSSNVWSETFVRVIEITSDTTAPTAVINKENQDWTNENIDIQARFNDTGGSGFNSQRYAISNSSVAPPSAQTASWNSWESGLLRDITIMAEGVHYLHVEAKDNEGNLVKKTTGPYKIDKGIPVLTVTPDNNRQPHENLIINLQASDGSSGINKIIMPDGSSISNIEGQYIIKKNGTYIFIAEDAAKNKHEVRIEVNNIIKTLDFKIPNIANELNVEIKENMYTETGVGELKITDWRDETANNWKVYLEASNLKNGIHTLPDGVMSLDGIQDIIKADGDKSSSLSYVDDKKVIDDGRIELISSINERGAYVVSFKDKALNFNFPTGEVRKGAYNTKLTWTLESTSEIN